MRAVQTLTEPKGIDAYLARVTPKITIAFPGLANVYGKAEIQEIDGGRARKYTPVIYSSDLEYVPLLPNYDKLGSYSFFVIDDPTRLADPNDNTAHFETTYNLSFICWFKYSDLYVGSSAIVGRAVMNDAVIGTSEGYEVVSIENVKQSFFDFFVNLRVPGGRLRVLNIFERKENVFEDMDLQGVAGKYWLRPYGCIRLEMEVKTTELC